MQRAYRSECCDAQTEQQQQQQRSQNESSASVPASRYDAPVVMAASGPVLVAVVSNFCLVLSRFNPLLGLVASVTELLRQHQPPSQHVNRQGPSRYVRSFNLCTYVCKHGFSVVAYVCKQALQPHYMCAMASISITWFALLRCCSLLHLWRCTTLDGVHSINAMHLGNGYSKP